MNNGALDASQPTRTPPPHNVLAAHALSAHVYTLNSSFTADTVWPIDRAACEAGERVVVDLAKHAG